MIVEADSIACMSRILRGAGPIDQSSIFELVTVCGDAKAIGLDLVGLDLAPAPLAPTNGVIE